MEHPNSKFTVSGDKLLHVLHDLDGNAYPLFLAKLRYFSSPSLYAIRPGQYFDRALAPIDFISVWFCADGLIALMIFLLECIIIITYVLFIQWPFQIELLSKTIPSFCSPMNKKRSEFLKRERPFTDGWNYAFYRGFLL